MLLLCPWVEPVWFGGLLNYRIDKHDISTLHQWLRDCVTVGLNTKEERNRVLDHIGLTSWTIWKIRNRAIFNNWNPHPQRALKSISDQVNKRLLLKHKITHPTLGNNRQTPQVRWIAPPASLAKINVHSAWHQGSCSAGVGIIIRNSEGSFRGAKYVSFHAETVLDAETVALLEGCKFARERNLTKDWQSSGAQSCVAGTFEEEYGSLG
ncbi:unnamed protein product [Prunus armeniaca]|nr:hypothetical protein GBA52_019180 [Prunus armeniaca]